MKIDTNSWHYKLYVFNCQLVSAWTGYEQFYMEPDHQRRIGLCPYARMLLIWGPLIMSSYLAMVLVVIGCLIVFPILINGVIGISWFFGTMFTIAGVIYLTSRFLEKRDHLRKETPRVVKENDDSPSFWQIVKEYIKACKLKICPIMEIKQDD